MFLDRQFGYPESLDYTTLPDFRHLTRGQQTIVQEEHDRAYHLFIHMGMKIATGRAFETAKRAIREQSNAKPTAAGTEVPPSIFAHLEV